jgi:hypothetical protein
MVKKKTAEEFRKEIEMLNKSTQPMAIGKVPAPFLGKQKRGTGNAMRKAVSQFDVSAEGVKDNLTPVEPAPVLAAKEDSEAEEPSDFPLKTLGDNQPVVDYEIHQETVGSELLRMAEPIVVPEDKIEQGYQEAKKITEIEPDQFGFSSDITMQPVGLDSVDVMPFSTTDADRTDSEVEESAYTPEDLALDIKQGISEFVAAPVEVPESEAMEAVGQLADVGDLPRNDPEFDLMPEVTAPHVGGGTPFGGLPDAMPAGPMLGGDMGGEAAPAHVPNEEMLERMDGAATSMSDYMEANTQILEGFANAIQALMVRMKNVESQIERF